MQSARLLASLAKRLEVGNSCDQCWALLRAASSSWPAAATAAVSVSCRQAVSAAAQGQGNTLSTAAAAPAATQPSPAAGDTGSDGASSQPQEQQRRSKRQLQHAAGATFDELREQFTAQLSIRNSQGEDKLLSLIQHAGSADQLASALDVVRWDRANRARLTQVGHISTRTTRALLRAGSQAGLGPSWAVRVLREADELGLQVSLGVCEEVLEVCIRQQDYWRAAEAWVYTRAYCAGPAATQQEAAEAAVVQAEEPSGTQQQQQPQQQQPAGGSSQLAWANNSILRVYAAGLASWLQQGCVSKGHERYVGRQLQEIVKELVTRGAAVPARLQEALQPQAPPAAAAATDDPAVAGSQE